MVKKNRYEVCALYYSYLSIYMFTLRIHLKMAKAEKPLAPGVALSFGKVMKNLSDNINW